MTTELEQLKKNAEEQFVEERLNELTEYLRSLVNKAEDTFKWSMRATKLEMVTMVAYLTTIILGIVLNLPDDIFNEIIDWAFLLLVLVVGRGWYLHSLWSRADGELDGCINTLKVLKMFDIEDMKGTKKRTRKRKSLFPRFKEFFERMQSKDKMEQYAGAH